MPSQSYMSFNGISLCELGQYFGGIYNLLCVCVCVCVCVCTSRTATRTHTQQLIYASTILTEFTRTSTIESHVTLARHRCSPHEDGSFVFRNMSRLFLYVILYVFFNVILVSINFL